MAERLGYPGRWINGQLFDDGGLPVHLYPFPVTIDGRGPAYPDEAFRMECWCHFEGCVGSWNEVGLPAHNGVQNDSPHRGKQAHQGEEPKPNVRQGDLQ